MQIGCLGLGSSRSCEERIHGSELNRLEVHQKEGSDDANATSARLPGSQHSSTYSPVDGSASLVGIGKCSKPVPPVGRRTKRFVIRVVKCDPGRNERAPFSAVHFSRGIQNPRADGGSVYWFVRLRSVGEIVRNT